jgi:DNA-binding MarR family transcriptional regulator
LRSGSNAAELDSEAPANGAAPTFDLIELLFFAYRDFVGDADRLLEKYGFGRAHHRVLHFVSRRPGLTVAELLDILKITKQSLNRVMKDLLDGGFVDVRAGVSDRRQRLLFPTARGRELAVELATVQSQRFRRALDELPDGAEPQMAQFLLSMVDRADRAKVMALISPGTSPLVARP